MEKSKNDMIETEEIETDTGIVTVNELSSGEIRVTIPEGLSEEQKTSLMKDLETRGRVLPAYYAKLNALNKERAELERMKADLAAGSDTTDTKDTGDPGKNQDEPMTVWEILGLQDEDALDDFRVEFPQRYEKAVREAAAKQARAEVRKEMEEQAQSAALTRLEDSIRADGYDPLEVKAYASYLGAPFSEKVYTAYRLHHGEKTDPVLQARLSAQQKQVSFIEGPARRTPFRAGQVDAKTLRNMSDEELAAYRRHLDTLYE